MRFNPASRSGRLWRLTGLMVVLAAIAAVIVSATGASAKNDNAKARSSSSGPTAKAVDGTLLNGTLPKNGSPASGGTITYGEITGQTPTDISPIINGATCSTQELRVGRRTMYIPLSNYGPPNGAPGDQPE